MRVLVTGATNAVGQAIVRGLAAKGHSVRAFGVAPQQYDLFAALPNVACFPGIVEVGGSIEPVLSECQALVHAACFDPPAKDKQAHAVHIERGTLYARYGAERELVDHFVHVAPPATKGPFRQVLATALDHVKAARKVPWTAIVGDGEGDAVARQTVAALGDAKQHGRVIEGGRVVAA